MTYGVRLSPLHLDSEVYQGIAKFPEMTFIIDHLAHIGNNGGEMEKWGPAIDALGKLPNVYMKMGASEQWNVDNPGAVSIFLGSVDVGAGFGEMNREHSNIPGKCRHWGLHCDEVYVRRSQSMG